MMKKDSNPGEVPLNQINKKPIRSIILFGLAITAWIVILLGLYLDGLARGDQDGLDLNLHSFSEADYSIDEQHGWLPGVNLTILEHIIRDTEPEAIDVDRRAATAISQLLTPVPTATQSGIQAISPIALQTPTLTMAAIDPTHIASAASPTQENTKIPSPSPSQHPTNPPTHTATVGSIIISTPPTYTPTPRPTRTATRTPTHSGGLTPSPTAADLFTGTPTFTHTPTITPRSESTPTVTSTPTKTSTPNPTGISSTPPGDTLTPTPTLTSTATHRPTLTTTPTPTSLPSLTPTFTITPSPTPTDTNAHIPDTPTPMPSATNTPEASSTPIPGNTPTITPIPTDTATPGICREPDPISGYVSWIIPSHGSIDVPVIIQPNIRFNQPMDISTLTYGDERHVALLLCENASCNQRASVNATIQIGTSTYLNDTVTILPSAELLPGRTYRVVVGNQIRNHPDCGGINQATRVISDFQTSQ